MNRPSRGGPASSRRTFLRLGAGAGAAVAGITLAGTGLSWAAGTPRDPRRAAATKAAAGGSPLYFPPAEGDWEQVDPAAAGWDPAALDRALEFARERDSTGVVMVQDGRIVAERYWGGADASTVRDVASVQKGITCALVGIACAAGSLQVDDAVSDVLGAGWSRAPVAHERAITVEHLMSMTSGLDEVMRSVSPPGWRWAYVTTAYHQLHPVLAGATGEPLEDWTSRVLFDPIGAGGAAWSARPAGGPRELGLSMTPRDMARFGLLTLAGGRWADERVVDEAYLRRAQQPSQELNPAYGWLWWLNGQSRFLTPGSVQEYYDGPLVPEAPGDMTCALGAEDQKIYVVPSLGVVIVRQGGSGAAGGGQQSRFDRQWWELLSRAVPSAG